MDTTPNLGLKLPALTDNFSLEGHWNYNSGKIDEFAGTVNGDISELQSALAALEARVEALEGGGNSA